MLTPKLIGTGSSGRELVVLLLQLLRNCPDFSIDASIKSSEPEYCSFRASVNNAAIPKKKYDVTHVSLVDSTVIQT